MPLAMDWENLAYGAIIGEAAEHLLGEEEPQEEVFQLLLEPSGCWGNGTGGWLLIAPC